MNNKFKRFNKILMMTVAILLCFVLISTSVVSGIFAKYVITKSAGATVSLKAFGLTLTVAGKSGVTIGNKVNSTSVDVAVSGISLAPGEKIDDVVTFTIGGKAKVDTNLKITVSVVDYGTAFQVPSGTGGVSTATNYIPISLTAKVNGTEKTLTNAWASPAASSDFQTTLVTGIKTALSGSSSGSSVTKQICDVSDSVAEDPSDITTFSLGYVYPNNPTSVTTPNENNRNLIQTYFSTTNPSLSIIYTVSLEQIIPSNAS